MLLCYLSLSFLVIVVIIILVQILVNVIVIVPVVVDDVVSLSRQTSIVRSLGAPHGAAKRIT